MFLGEFGGGEISEGQDKEIAANSFQKESSLRKGLVEGTLSCRWSEGPTCDTSR